ncbi:MAG: DUF4340 domain-containing protein [Oscillospiraceae bacterium]|nr:DUF4340 domain-containing protein [Oscillospiraceae bacterium]
MGIFKRETLGKKQTLIWVVFVLVCSVFLVLAFSRGNVSELSGDRLFDVRFKTVRKIEVTNPNGGYVISNGASGLQLQSVAERLVDAEKLKDFVDGLFGSKVSKVDIDENRCTSNVQVALRVECRGKTFEIKVRDEAPADLGYYVSISRKSGVYLLPKSVADLLFCSHLDFVSRGLFKNFSANGDFDELVFSGVNPNPVSVLRTVGENSLVLENKGEKALLLDVYRDQIDKLVRLQADAVKVINPTRADQETYGVFTPRLQVTAKRGAISETIRMSEPVDGVCFVLGDDGCRILECNVADFSFLDAKFDDICKRHLVEGNRDKIKSLSIKVPQKRLNMELRGATNSGVVVNGKEVVDEKVTSGLNDLLELLTEFPFKESVWGELNEDRESELSLEIGYGSEDLDKYEFWVNNSNVCVKYGKSGPCLAALESDLKGLLAVVSALMADVEAI